MAIGKSSEIDSSMFENMTDNNQDFLSWRYDKKYDICVVIDRLLTPLSYYSDLNINNTNDKLIFINFFENVYKYKIIDDFHRLTKYHGNTDDIFLILNLAIKSFKLLECDVSSCLYCDRHHRMVNGKLEQDDDDHGDDHKSDNEEISMEKWWIHYIFMYFN